ncbi:hypothetical protein GCM10020331_005380 [Ectobacillus funiculus]
MCLREQIAAYLLQSRGVKTDANAIIIGSSTQQMLINLGHILKDDFPSITVEDPGYDGAREAFSISSFLRLKLYPFMKQELIFFTIRTNEITIDLCNPVPSQSIWGEHVHSTTANAYSLG